MVDHFTWLSLLVHCVIIKYVQINVEVARNLCEYYFGGKKKMQGTALVDSQM